MAGIFKMNRRMENFLGYNPANEIRPDTVGALSDEIRYSEEIRSHYIKEKKRSILSEENSKCIGAYYTDKKTGEIKIFRCKSRGIEILGTVKFDFEKETIEDIPTKKNNSDLENNLNN